MSTMQSVNPATEEILSTFQKMDRQEVDSILAESVNAFRSWRSGPLAQRVACARELANVLRQNADRFASTISSEMGKTLNEAKGEVNKCAGHCEYFAEKAGAFLAPESISDALRPTYVSYEPLGVILAIMPWNFPFWQVLRFAVPAMLAGNTVILKHASNVTGSALAIESAFRDAGFPSGTFRTLVIPSADVGSLIADDRIAAVTLTGSEVAGREVAAAAGRALKKVVLELGGSDPFIVLEDADISGAAEYAARSRFQNAGQSCIAAKRFIVLESIADQFEQAFVERANAIVVGDPDSAGTQMGPLARADLRTILERQLAESVKEGAKILTGGRALARKGYFFEPTVVGDVSRKMSIFREETFGPVAAVVRVKTIDEAIDTANDCIYGLSSNIWTRDISAAKALAKRIEAGGVFINGMTASAPQVPFGGIKKSGFGRELSVQGIREFTNLQTVWIERE
ncbi:NAD-dependent succinate-semialdehyde dehydrogenase [Roseixanthobacter liquoris]|uniref:NAD-dependent succinate-semialdehyde dehydrogenase n=1 Tax=Roseixanthobacter liquoris TaxID=3119921 RepID=UPI00372A775A